MAYLLRREIDRAAVENFSTILPPSVPPPKSPCYSGKGRKLHSSRPGLVFKKKLIFHLNKTVNFPSSAGKLPFSFGAAELLKSNLPNDGGGKFLSSANDDLMERSSSDELVHRSMLNKLGIFLSTITCVLQRSSSIITSASTVNERDLLSSSSRWISPLPTPPPRRTQNGYYTNLYVLPSSYPAFMGSLMTCTLLPAGDAAGRFRFFGTD